MRNLQTLKDKTHVLIAGAGIAGCAAAQMLQDKGIDYLLVERNVEPGGLTRSISIGGAHFDYTGHFMHLARCKTPAEIPYAHQRDEDWMHIERRSAVYVKDKMIPAPLQYNLYYLPEMTRQQWIRDFRTRPDIKGIRSFREYLLAGFGQGICESFLFPYNEKLLARALDEFALECVKRFFPPPDRERIELGYKHEGVNLKTGYNSQFWYPKTEGIRLLSRGLAKDLTALQTNCGIEMVDLKGKCAYTRQGKVRYENMLFSVPLKEFCLYTNNPLLHSLAFELHHTQVLCMNCLIKGTLPDIFKGVHWIYIPGRKVPFYRMGIYSNISPIMNPKDTTAVYIETAFMDNAKCPSVERLLNETFNSLEDLGWADRNSFIVLAANWIGCAYVHFDFKRDQTVKKIFAILKKYDVYPIGRYGLWDYISMEDSILSSIEKAGMFV